MFGAARISVSLKSLGPDFLEPLKSTIRSAYEEAHWQFCRVRITMPVIRRVKPADLFHLNLCNLDPYTENYDISFYLSYLMKWPSLFFCLEENSQIVGYIIGKVEASPSYLQFVNVPQHQGITNVRQKFRALSSLAWTYHSIDYCSPVS